MITDYYSDDLGYGNPDIFICTDYSCQGCGARNCPVTRYEVPDILQIFTDPRGHTLVSFAAGKYVGYTYCSVCDDHNRLGQTP